MAQDFGFDFKPKPMTAFDAVLEMESSRPKPKTAFDAVMEQETAPTAGDTAINLGKAAVQGFGETALSAVLRAPAALGRGVFNAIATDEQRRQRDRGLPGGKVALERLADAGSNVLPETDPRLEGLGTDVARGVGSSLALGPLALGGGAAGVALGGALANGASGFQEAKKFGASDDTAFIGFALSAAGGTSEAIPLARIFGRINRASGGALRNLIVEGGEELLQEGSQTAFSNVLAANLFDEDRPVLQGVLESGAAGGLSGALLSALASAVPGRSSGAQTALEPRTSDAAPQEPSPAAPATQGSEPNVSILEGESGTEIVTSDGPVPLPRPGFIASGAYLPEAERGKGLAQNEIVARAKEHGRVWMFEPFSQDILNAVDALERKGMATVKRGEVGGVSSLEIEPIVSEPAPLDDPDIAAALEAARPKPLDVPAAMPSESGLFGQQEREAKPAPERPEQRVSQGMLLDVQEGDLPGQKSLLDEEFQEPTFEEQLADKSLHPWIGGLAEEAGQAQVGGMLLRDADRNVIGRTKWAPKSEWWNERPLPKQFPEKRFKAVAEKMLAGKKLGPAERQVAEFILHKAGSQKAAFEAEQRYLASQPVEAVDEERAAIQSANEPVPTRRILRAKKIADLSAEIDRSFRDLGRKAQTTPFSGPGLDPERVAAVAKIASLYVQKGYLKAEQFIEDVVSKLGEEMRPYAEAAWRLASEPSSQGVSPTQPQAGPEGAVEPKVVAAPPQPPAEATPADQPSPIDFTLAPETATETIRRKMEDYFIRPRKVLGQVKAQGARVEEASDVSLKQDLASNKAAARVERVMDRQRAAVKLIAAGKIPLEESAAGLPSVREFFVARHAEARNAALMQGENPRGLDMEENPGSGMATSRARAILAQAAASPAAEQYAALGRLVDGVLATKRRRQVESGLESEESIAAYEAKYGPSYVPLKTAQPGGRPIPTSGKSLQVRGRENRSAQGRESLADNPLVMALRDAAETEVRAENNLVGQSLGKLITDNPSPLWELYDSTAAIPAEDVKAGNVFTFKENGNERYAVVRDQKFVEAMKGLAPANQHEWVRAIGKLARIYKQLHTTWNFAFPASNLQRDIGSAGLNLAAREVKGFGKGALKRIPATIKAGIQLASDPDAKGQTADYLREYRETGGKIGWVEPRAFEDQIALIQKDIDVEAGKAPTRKALRRLRDLVEGANEVVESSTRAAAYIEARKRGYSKDRSASIALHVSTPFSRRGEWGPTMNALWLFSQAQIQGSVNMARTLRGPAGRRIAAGLVAAGFATSLLNRYGGGEDEERGVPYWDTYEQDTKSRYFRLLIPGTEGKSVGFALPWGFSTLFYMGTLAEELSAGSIDEGQAAMKLATSALQSVSPVSGADPMQALTPWFARPAWELYTNKKYSGAPITPAAEPYDRTPEPRYKRNFKSAGDTSIAVAELLNKVTGGDDVTPGALDVSGSQVGYVGEQLGGGLGRSTLRLYSAAERFLSGEPTPFSTVPLFNTVVGEPSEYFDSKRYFENLSTLDVARERRKAGKELDPEQRAALKHDLSAKAIEKQIESQRKLLKTARKDETKKAIGERIEKLRQQLNRRFAEAAK